MPLGWLVGVSTAIDRHCVAKNALLSELRMQLLLCDVQKDTQINGTVAGALYQMIIKTHSDEFLLSPVTHLMHFLTLTLLPIPPMFVCAFVHPLRVILNMDVS